MQINTFIQCLNILLCSLFYSRNSRLAPFYKRPVVTSDFPVHTSQFISSYIIPMHGKQRKVPIQSSHFILHSSRFRLQSSYCILHSSHFTLTFQTSHFVIQTSQFRLHSSNFTVITSHFILQTSQFRLHIL